MRTMDSDVLFMYDSVQDYGIILGDLNARIYFVQGFLGDFRLVMYPLMAAQQRKVLTSLVENMKQKVNGT
ncbi:unnamed protein product [Microthlaspi erraticum]|uniref:Uncharacterized protein n=1 Tax=Microthlaspi erraticum TaxID=1685480 RepID=A0A6D2L766_9BRAS|nr:unnamed protein product [Microthlaspi erraticum]